MIKTALLDAGIFHISLNRPEQLNALSIEVLQQLSSIFQQIKLDKSILAVLLTGEGKVFCAGADIKQLACVRHDGLDFAHLGQRVFRELELLGKPSLAAIHGVAFGGGCELAMSASMRIAAQQTVFGQPEIKLGIIPGFGGTQRLSRLIGKGRAIELCLTGRRFSVEEAFQWGLVNEIVAPDQLIERGINLLKTITPFSTMASRSILTVIHQGYDLALEEANELEAAYFALCCAAPDKQEGVNAFLEKRTPVFNRE